MHLNAASDAQATDVVKGTEPLFKIRVTHMGDGSSVISASFAHVLADAGRTTEVMAHLSALYRGEWSRESSNAGSTT